MIVRQHERSGHERHSLRGHGDDRLTIGVAAGFRGRGDRDPAIIGPMPALGGDVLSGMITPALLISASGTLVLSTSNRLSRVVDRVRVLTAEAERSRAVEHAAPSRRRTELISSQLQHLSRRAMLLRSSMTALYAAIGFLIATSIGVAFVVILGLPYWVPVTFALAGACSLLYGSLLLVREARDAVVSTLEEMAYTQELVASGAGRNTRT